jgi:hypothetical protein
MKRRINTLEEADAAKERLAWLRGAGHPNGAVRELMECCGIYRQEVHRMQKLLGQETGWRQRVEKGR